MPRSRAAGRVRSATVLPSNGSRAKVAAMTAEPPDPTEPTVDEPTRLRAIAARHGLSGDGLIDLVADIRRHARNRRRRLSDNQIEAVISDLGVRR